LVLLDLVENDRAHEVISDQVGICVGRHTTIFEVSEALLSHFPRETDGNFIVRDTTRESLRRLERTEKERSTSLFAAAIVNVERLRMNRVKSIDCFFDESRITTASPHALGRERCQATKSLSVSYSKDIVHKKDEP